MNNLNNLLDKETVSSISELVQSKMKLLNQIHEFKEYDRSFANALENFENSLSRDSYNQFEDIIKLNYKLSDYYFTLAYFLGMKHGKQISKL